MLKRFRPVSLILLVGALGFSGNLYATPMSGIPRVDISQQNAKVSGIVEDALGPVTGASVIVKGTTNGTMTDLDGHFTLDTDIVYRLYLARHPVYWPVRDYG